MGQTVSSEKAMEQTPIRAVEMVRAIRDAIYEETKDFSPEELIAYFRHNAAVVHQKIGAASVAGKGDDNETNRE